MKTKEFGQDQQDGQDRNDDGFSSSPSRKSCTSRLNFVVFLCTLCVSAWSFFGSTANASTCGTSSRAVNHHQVIVANQSAVVVPSGFIVVPFAVPVAVPSYVQYQAAAAPQGAGGEEKTVEAQSDPRPLASEPRSLVTSSCMKCHSGSTPKGKLDLSGELSPAVRLRSIARIFSDDPTRRMPKGKSLDAQAIGLLIQELSRPQPKKEAAD